MRVGVARWSIGILAALSTCFAQPADKLRVLIVDGINNHDWGPATRAVKIILSNSRRFQVDVSTTPPREAPKEAWDGWRPKFSDYQAVLINFNGGHTEDGIRWPAEVEQALEKYVRSGGGLIVFHAANNAFLHWTAYNEMIGLGWREKSFGPGLTISSDGKVEVIPQGSGLNPGHGPRHDFQMAVMPTDHPITRGMPMRWMHPSEQLTHGQHGPAQGLTILTYAYSKDSKQNEPMDWVRDYGRGRVYTTMLGHTWKNEPSPNLECVGFQTLLARGVEWAASGRVTIPIPAEFPGPDKILLKPLAEKPAGVSADQALRVLLEGNRRYAAGSSSHPHLSTERRSALTAGQKPIATVLSCSDSRVPPEEVFDQGLGDIFVIRVAGNVLDDHVIGSIEYAVEHLGTELIIVMGHERCGAVTAALEGGKEGNHIDALLRSIAPAVEAGKSQPGDPLDNAIRSNIQRVAVELGQSQPLLQKLIAAGKLKVVSAEYHLGDGSVEVLRSK